MRKVLVVTATTAVGIALLSCTAPQPSAVNSPTTTSMINEPSGSVVRAPLSPPVGYAPGSPLPSSPTPLVPYANAPNEGSEVQTPPQGAWRASPRWAAVKGDGCIVVDQYPQAKFAAPAEAAKARIENCPKEGADDLTSAQPEDVSGY